MKLDGRPADRVAAIATRLVNLGWFRVGGDRYPKRSRTFEITSLRKNLGRHAHRGGRVRPGRAARVAEHYLDGRTIDDFRPRHLRVVGARDTTLDVEEQATLSLLRSWRIRASRAAA
jgi:DNA topoisomerase IB